jgi:hypothetical protein
MDITSRPASSVLFRKMYTRLASVARPEAREDIRERVVRPGRGHETLSRERRRLEDRLVAMEHPRLTPQETGAQRHRDQEPDASEQHGDESGDEHR